MRIIIICLIKVLILVVMEDTLREVRVEDPKVLILVVMEDTLRG